MRQPLDERGHGVRSRLGNDSRTRFQKQQGIGLGEQGEAQGQQIVVEDGYRDGQQAAEKIPAAKKTQTEN